MPPGSLSCNTFSVSGRKACFWEEAHLFLKAHILSLPARQAWGSSKNHLQWNIMFSFQRLSHTLINWPRDPSPDFPSNLYAKKILQSVSFFKDTCRYTCLWYTPPSFGFILQAYIHFIVLNVKPILRYICSASDESKNGTSFAWLALVLGYGTATEEAASFWGSQPHAQNQYHFCFNTPKTS